MFQKVFEYAGPHKKGLYAATAVVLVSVLMGVLPFVLAYQVIAPLVMGGDNRCLIYHPASCACAGLPGAASYSLWMGAEHFTQGGL